MQADDAAYAHTAHGLEHEDVAVGNRVDLAAVDDRIASSVLKTDKLLDLTNRLRPLQYGEAFLLVPWLVLGGLDEPQNYEIGGCAVYLNLVAQYHFRD